MISRRREPYQELWLLSFLVSYIVRSVPFCLCAGILNANIAGHGAFERRGLRLAELQAAGNAGMCLRRYTLSLAQNFQENSVGGKEKQPRRARLGRLTELPGAHIPAVLQ